MNIINVLKHKKIYIISPHYDDAVLSCGCLISELKGRADVSVVNVFTAVHSGPYTLSAKKFLWSSGARDGVELFKKREKEDEIALQSVKVKTVNLGLQDALFRKKSKPSFLGVAIPEFDHIYPVYRTHILRDMSPEDNVATDLKTKLSSFKDKNAVFLLPYGVGGHVDHRIVRKIGEEVFDNIILYSDFPYNVRGNDYGRTPKSYKKHELAVDLFEKEALVRKYKTQFKGLFSGKGLPAHKEVYFVKN